MAKKKGDKFGDVICLMTNLKREKKFGARRPARTALGEFKRILFAKEFQKVKAISLLYAGVAFNLSDIIPACPQRERLSETPIEL